MASPSKEGNILKLILENSPLKEWHFDEIVKEAKVTRAVSNKWLKRYVKKGILKRIKQKGAFPYFTAGPANHAYYAEKRHYALEKLYSSGLIEHLLSLHNAKTVIVFGSIIKGDWYKDSDIDIFIFGKASNFNRTYYQKKLGRQIELHLFENKKEIRDVKTGLIKNIINGYLIKGEINDIAGVA